MAQPGQGRKGHGQGADENQVGGAAALAVPRVMGDQLRAALARVDAPGVERIGTVDLVLAAEGRRVRGRGDIHAHARDRSRPATEIEAGADERLLGRGQEAQRPRAREHLVVDGEAQRRLVVGRRHEDAARGRRSGQAPVGRVVQVREEDDGTIGGGLRGEGLDQARRVRSLAAQPVDLLVVRVRPGVQLFRVAVEGVEVALLLDREAPHADAGHLGLPRRQLVAPGHVVAGARGVDGDAIGRGQALGDRTRQRLRAARDLGPVALDDERDLRPRGHSEST